MHLLAPIRRKGEDAARKGTLRYVIVLPLQPEEGPVGYRNRLAEDEPPPHPTGSSSCG
jgi:hypothetical protein